MLSEARGFLLIGCAASLYFFVVVLVFGFLGRVKFSCLIGQLLAPLTR